MSPEARAHELVRALAPPGGVRGDGRDRNPFESERVRPGARAWESADGPSRGADVVWECLEDALAARVGLIAGPHGSGKSTLLRHVVALATDRGLDAAIVHQGGAIPTVATLSRLDLVASDAAGYTRPVWWARLAWRCRRAGVPLLATARREWFGTIVHRRRVSVAEAAAVIAACLEGTDAEVPDQRLLSERLAAGRGSLRSVLWSLYDDWERGERLAPGWPDGA